MSKITIINETEIDFEGTSALINLNCIGSNGVTNIKKVVVEANSQKETELPLDSEGVVCVEYHLKLRNRGSKWKDETQRHNDFSVQSVVEGGVYHIILDTECPILNPIMVVNKTPDELNCHAVNVKGKMKNGGFMTSMVGKIEGNSEKEVNFPLEDYYTPCEEYYLSLSQMGYKWENETKKNKDISLQKVVKGDVYNIIFDNENPPITTEEAENIRKLVQEELENHTPYPNIWPIVHSKLPTQERRPIDLLNDIVHKSGITRNAWHEFYEARIPCEWVTPQILEEELQIGGNALIEVYWRALDRFPGGNADLRTICYSIECSKSTIIGRDYYNWDGQQESKEFVPYLDPTTSFPEKLNNFLKSLKNNLPFNSECTFVDNNTMDSDEYDTEWSSQEIIVYLPLHWSPNTHTLFDDITKKAMHTFLLIVNTRFHVIISLNIIKRIVQYMTNDQIVPAQRIHRACCMGENWHDWGKPRKRLKHDKPASFEQKDAFDKANQLIGMGRVNEYTDAGDEAEPCLAAHEPEQIIEKRECNYVTFLPYIQPFYFNWRASNEIKRKRFLRERV